MTALAVVWIKFPPSHSAERPESTNKSTQTDSEPMDLFEYQAKELFAKHDVPTTPGRVTDTAEDARPSPRRSASR